MMMNNGTGTKTFINGGTLNVQPVGFHPRGLPMSNVGGTTALPIREINGNKVNRKAFSKRKGPSNRKRKDLDRERSEAATAPVELSYSDT